ncbi:ankyrin repeat domain-containing protein 13C-like [Punica granatum]|uniref:Ankyrin repeat domain-containing protein n=2 Tax=Punica granatum TaxID=22663 RepID=A0A218XPY8_PUNGR|nr:ankyrin repeat domain-containing protein 13C-like [Punica granatum]OWM86332.1 hypothetical protein CDL15_Pgr010674 [Punica granatum]PKI56854.1 hypothetical protein CRG98_022741 [Punica granatum]
MAKSPARPSTTALSSLPSIKPKDYAHSPVHYAVAVGDHNTLSRLVSTLPRLCDVSQIQTEADSLAQEQLAEQISSAVDRRDVPFRETPLHLAVRLNDPAAARTLAEAGADVSLHNSAGWNPLQEAMCRRYSEVARILVRHHHGSAWKKWRRRLPRLIAVLRRMRDFYMEISFHFESSVIPFLSKIAPSDTYKIWKRDGNLRADTSLAGFDGMKIKRADQSFLFLGEGDASKDIPIGSLLVLNRDSRKVYNVFENAGAPMSDSEAARYSLETSFHRPGMDVTRAELVGRTNWRRHDKTEHVGEWKARVYDIHNVVFSMKSREVVSPESDVAGSEQVLPLELDEDEDGFLVAENPSFGLPPPDARRHSSFVREESRHSNAHMSAGRKSVDIPFSAAPPRPRSNRGLTTPMPQTKETEVVRNLRPSVWLTEQFPLKTEELLPLLDILANKVKAVRRMREMLTTKFPPGTFPVKVAIPVVPTVRVVITFTKFMDLQPIEQFYTPFSSPIHFLSGGRGAEEEEDFPSSRPPSSSSSYSAMPSWAKKTSKEQQKLSSVVNQCDTFAIPDGYTFTPIDEKLRKMKKSKSVRKSK